ncbi:pyridoxal phosphate-dependent decarboxylase family protein [Sciscionella sediminilitoris]|uniref:pyridoxal phosphate-dependent decarboxylase family protein n=1 Tax=Sciscionella sediminilitoris TaxID=1445613 RepID=UPI0004DF2358|nr:pyridoxal-dependent decarboxylase [Sciscionella sp. SE31]
MDRHLAEDLRALPALLEEGERYAVGVLGELTEHPAGSTGPAPDPVPVPETGIGARAALAEFAARWAPGFSGSAGPRYLGFVTGGATPAALLGDWLTAVFDQNASAAVGSTAVDLERETVTWLADLFGLGSAHTGTFVSGATMSNLLGLAVGREWLGERAGVSVTEDGADALGPVPVLSGTPHSSAGKALSVLGIGRRRLRTVPALPGREAVDLDALESALAGLAGRPAIVIANAGTVNTVDFDDLAGILALRERYPFWLHVDAAFGGFAALSPAHAALLTGLDAADSVCVDLHKWLNVPYDSAVAFTRRPDLQRAVFHNAAAYLGAPGANPDPMHLAPENSRRLRALAAWFGLRAYGRKGHAEIVRRTCALAHSLGAALEQRPHWRLLSPVRLNVACFTLAESPSRERLDAVLHALAEDGTTFLTPTTYAGVPALRAAFSNWRTEPADVTKVIDALDRAGGYR